MKKQPSEPLTLKEVLAIVWRSFFIQAAWNFKSMISIGFCYALSPVAKKICKNKEQYIAFLRRHLGFFNAHPYFASYALGAIARLERERYLHNEPDETVIDKFKNALIGPLGAVGDQCCWAVIRPAVLILGLTGLAYFQTLPARGVVLLFTLILYNIPHVYIRVKGVLDGYQYGVDIYRELRIERFERILTVFKILAVIGLGMFVDWVLHYMVKMDLKMILLFFITLSGSFWMRKTRRVFYTPIIVSMGLAIIFGVL